MQIEMAESGNYYVRDSFPVPNFYVDEVMHFLTSEEWKVLVYMMRCILGFQKHIQAGTDYIAMSQFTVGQRTRESNPSFSFKQNGQRYSRRGTGLSGPKVKKAIDALVHFGLVRREGQHRKYGISYWLERDWEVIDFIGLYARRDAQEAKNRAKIRRAVLASARSKKHSATLRRSERDFETD